MKELLPIEKRDITAICESVDAYFADILQHRLLCQVVEINGQPYHVVGRTPDELAAEVARMREEHTVSFPAESQPLQEQYPLGVHVDGTFQGIPFHAVVIGYQPAVPDQGECLDLDIINPDPRLPVHRCAKYKNPWDYQIYDTFLCLDPVESNITVSREIEEQEA